VTVRASTPGKLILMGEHSVVYGHPALVTAVDRRVTVTFDPAPEDELTLHLPALNYGETTTWREIVGYAARARERWERFARRPGSSRFGEVRGRDPAHVVKVALGEVALASDDAPLPGLRLRVASDLPVGRGFGSSAAVAVAVVAGALAFAGSDPRPGRVERLALEVERRQHGLPSGVDGATVLRGGVLWAEGGDRREEGIRVRSLGEDLPLLDRMRVFDTGEPSRETGAVVAAVRERIEERPTHFGGVLKRMGGAVEEMRTILEEGGTDEEGLALEAIRGFQRDLGELGVVPEAVARRVRGVEAAGGAAKISGAGAPAEDGGPGAGPLLAFHPEPGGLDGIEVLEDLPPFRAPLGASGLDVRRDG